MGKTGYKKFKKQEKAKVKLKGNKTLLPKGQNVTDTNFKVKKIIVKEQLKGHSEDELLSRKHLSVKELISRLSHHNVSVRQDALSGLRELVTAHGQDIVLANLSSLIHTVMSLTVDPEADVRTDTLKLLSAVFEKVTEEELSPLFPVVVCHLTCAMTHIEPGVRADSLRLLDTMLATLPALTAKHTPALLPNFLDLISQRGGGQTRMLSLHLDGRVTSDKWRSRVIGRLNKLFSVILAHNRKDPGETVRTVRLTPDQHTYVGLYAPAGTTAKSADVLTKLPVQDYATTLMPLLLDTYTEAVPKQGKESSESACVIGMDAAALLQCIVEVILHIWNLLKQSSQAESSIKCFVNTWGESVMNRLLRGRFPYSVTTANSRKRRREADQVLAALQVSRNREPSCLLLNLELCLLTFLLTPPGDLWTQSIQYIKRSLRSTGPLRPEESEVLCQCLEAASEHPVAEDVPSLLGVVAKCGLLANADRPVNKKAQDFLTSIALKPSHHLHQDKYFTTWLDSLPAVLCTPSVSLSTVRSIAFIATRNLHTFTNTLDGWVEEILGNLVYLKVKGDKDKEGHKLILNLIYWASDWDEGLVDTLKQLINEGSLGPELTTHLVDVLRFKADNTEDTNLKRVLEACLPVTYEAESLVE